MTIEAEDNQSNLTENFDDYVIGSLREDPSEAIAYLNAALIEGDPKVFIAALRDITEAFVGNINQLAKISNLSRQRLYQALGKEGNPEVKTLLAILKALNVGFTRCSLEQPALNPKIKRAGMRASKVKT